MMIRKIVITGGPCAGKTTALSWIQNAFTKRGYTVLFVSETATELISGGVAPWTCGTNLDYQICQVGLQMEKEAVFLQAARTMKAEKILIVCDRGALDNRAYMSEREWEKVLETLGYDETELRDSYDAVFHLVTAAKGAEEAYTLANNTARYETPEQAAAMDDALLAAWTGHPHLCIIDNRSDFRSKLEYLISRIVSFLGEPEPFEVERKYLIRKPDTSWLDSLTGCRKIEMIQTYLVSPEGVQIRVRRRGTDGHYTYYYSEKRPVSDTRRVETEQRLSYEEYERYLKDADPSARPIRKTRYCLARNNQYFEIDLYPEWDRQAVLEVELKDDREEVVLPEGIGVIREVTGDPRYKNYSLAHEMAAED